MGRLQLSRGINAPGVWYKGEVTRWEKWQGGRSDKGGGEKCPIVYVWRMQNATISYVWMTWFGETDTEASDCCHCHGGSQLAGDFLKVGRSDLFYEWKMYEDKWQLALLSHYIVFLLSLPFLCPKKIGGKWKCRFFKIVFRLHSRKRQKMFASFSIFD